MQQPEHGARHWFAWHRVVAGRDPVADRPAAHPRCAIPWRTSNQERGRQDHLRTNLRRQLADRSGSIPSGIHGAQCAAAKLPRCRARLPQTTAILPRGRRSDSNEAALSPPASRNNSKAPTLPSSSPLPSEARQQRCPGVVPKSWISTTTSAICCRYNSSSGTTLLPETALNRSGGTTLLLGRSASPARLNRKRNPGRAQWRT